MKNILQLCLKAIIEMALGSGSQGNGKKDIGHRDELKAKRGCVHTFLD